jgi:hypothetical protein
VNEASIKPDSKDVELAKLMLDLACEGNHKAKKAADSFERWSKADEPITRRQARRAFNRQAKEALDRRK